jgi:hypothetical protein
MTIRFETENFTLEEHSRRLTFTLVNRSTGESIYMQGRDANTFDYFVRQVESKKVATDVRDNLLDDLCSEMFAWNDDIECVA